MDLQGVLEIKQLIVENDYILQHLCIVPELQNMNKTNIYLQSW